MTKDELINATYLYLIYQRDVRLIRDPDLLALIAEYESNPVDDKN